MRRFTLTSLLVLLAAWPAAAQQAVSHQTLTVMSGATAALAATTTNPTNIGPVTFCVGTVEGSPIRYWLDGSTPGPGSGHYVSAGGAFVLPSVQVAQGFSMTPVPPAGGNSTAQVSCFRGGSPVGFLTAFDPSLASGATVTAVPPSPTLPLPSCNALLRTNCK